jgi:hypothetical protein
MQLFSDNYIYKAYLVIERCFSHNFGLWTNYRSGYRTRTGTNLGAMPQKHTTVRTKTDGDLAMTND